MRLELPHVPGFPISYLAATEDEAKTLLLAKFKAWLEHFRPVLDAAA